jgi:glycosyltransferase involved in cell wall biosynthesis
VPDEFSKPSHSRKTLVIDGRSVKKTGHGIAEYLLSFIETASDLDPMMRSILNSLKVTSLTEIEIIFIISSDCPSESILRKYKTVTCDLSDFNFKSWFKIPRILKNLKADLFFNPSFSSFPYLPCPYIQTVHDLNHLYYGGVLYRLYYHLLLKRSIHGAEKVFTVSQFSQKEIAAWAHYPEARIEVHYNRILPPADISAEYAKTVLKKYGLDSKKYFLNVSNAKPHKNVKFLLKAYAKYRERAGMPLLPLITTCGLIDGFETAIGVLHLAKLDRSELSVLYRNARACFYPSLYEGFGRPPIEASLVHVKSYASDIPPHQEGKKLFQLDITLLDPSDEAAWVEAFISAAVPIKVETV